MSYEDSFEREAKDERAYIDFEKKYIYENLKPENIGRWEWDLMFDRVPYRYSYREAASDARNMARELKVSVKINKAFEGCWQAVPIDYYKIPVGSHWLNYATKRACFIEALVLSGKYPDIASIALAINHPDMYNISRHSSDESDKHQRWLKERKDL